MHNYKTLPLDNIGFYTLSERRVSQASSTSPLWRGELILGARCNFRCPYCRRVGGRDISRALAERVLDTWAEHSIQNVRLSGGEPTMYPFLGVLVERAKRNGAKRIAISTNGSAPLGAYLSLIASGVDDFSISLDACCASDSGVMNGGMTHLWGRVVENIRELSALVYVTVGIVVTEQNEESLNETVRFAHSLGVADIRVIPAAQSVKQHLAPDIEGEILRQHPILHYRIANWQEGIPVRGLKNTDSGKCGLVVDDVAVMGNRHYPCIIYLREGGSPIGIVGNRMREERLVWSLVHDTKTDTICRKNCLDVCIAYNNRYASLLEGRGHERK